MKSLPASTILAILITSILTGCASKPEKVEQEEEGSKVAVEAPLGSRIKKRSNVAPVSGATRQDIDNARVQQGIQQTGAVNRTGG